MSDIVFDEMSSKTQSDAVGKAELVDKKEDGSMAWLRQRQQGIGGSDAAAVIGLEPFGKTRYELYQEKLGRAKTFQGNYHTDYGSKLEDYLFKRARMEAAESRELDELSGAIRCEYSLRHPELNWMRGNVDGLIPGEGIVEIKTSQSEPPDSGAKRHHFAQIQHYLGVTGLDFAYYVYFVAPFDKAYALNTDSKFIPANLHDEYWEWIAEEGELYIRRIERDQPFIERLIDVELDFWQCVEDEEPPGDYLPEGEIEVEDETLAKYLDDYGKAKAKIDRLTSPDDTDELEQAKELKSRAKKAIKDHCSAFDAKKIHLPNGDYVTWNARGYWMAKPQERDIDENEVDAPF